MLASVDASFAAQGVRSQARDYKQGSVLSSLSTALVVITVVLNKIFKIDQEAVKGRNAHEIHRDA
jgi:hypothetical protein